MTTLNLTLTFLLPDGTERVIREECFNGDPETWVRWWTHGDGNCDCLRRLKLGTPYGQRKPHGHTIKLSKLEITFDPPHPQ